MKLLAPFRGEPVSRKEPCDLCGSATAIRIGQVGYWDIRTSDLVRCVQCGHIQLDPMLTEEETARGCMAYYIEESLRTALQESEKNCERNFRRGVVFGFKLKGKGIIPAKVLETGPGSGYFAAGLQFVFPEAEFTVMDINREVLKQNSAVHGFLTLEAAPETFFGTLKGAFDLVIARDLLEHLNHVSLAVANISRYLKPGGIFHFITPNGREDVWKHYLALQLTGKPSELLINHVNYFDGKGLKGLLRNQGLEPVEYFTYKFKYALRGRGWSRAAKHIAAPAGGKPAEEFIRREPGKSADAASEKKRITGKWYILPRMKRITWLYCLWHHFLLFRIRPEANFGHEISGLFRKSY